MLSAEEAEDMAEGKRGRPAKPAGEKRQVFTLRLSPAEREEVEAAAARDGEEVATWAREALLVMARQK
jgi:predicted HicB family RNase H-like nuclease